VGVPLRHLGHAVAARAVVAAGHLHGAAEGAHPLGDLLVVRRHDHLVERRAPGRGLVHPLHHRPPVEIGERLSGEAGRAVADRDDGEDVHAGGRGEDIPRRDLAPGQGR
jgi:hypothetical protein